MAVGTTTALLLGLGASALVGKMGAPKQEASPSPIPLPQPPSVEDSTTKASDIIRRKKASMTESIYTSPLGIAGEAQVARKTLLGQ